LNQESKKLEVCELSLGISPT